MIGAGGKGSGKFRQETAPACRSPDFAMLGGHADELVGYFEVSQAAGLLHLDAVFAVGGGKVGIGDGGSFTRIV